MTRDASTRERPRRTIEDERGDDDEDVPDGTSFVWISVESLLVLSALGIAGSLKLGGFSTLAAFGIFAGFYTIALMVAWILIVRRSVVTWRSERGDGSRGFELVKGLEAEEEEEMSAHARQTRQPPIRLNERKGPELYDSREESPRATSQNGQECEVPRRTKSQKLRSFFLAPGAEGLRKDENAQGTDSAEALSLVALLKARQPSSVH
ncbi:hypothetical protein JCM3766R1_003994 [Sporobolomyces carnicolor]